jgi:hypothetical protein
VIGACNKCGCAAHECECPAVEEEHVHAWDMRVQTPLNGLTQACPDCGLMRQWSSSGWRYAERFEPGQVWGDATPRLCFVRHYTAAELAEVAWERISVDTVPGRVPNPAVLHERARVAIVEMLLNRPQAEPVSLMQDVAKLLQEKIR